MEYLAPGRGGFHHVVGQHDTALSDIFNRAVLESITRLCRDAPTERPLAGDVEALPRAGKLAWLAAREALADEHC